MAQSVAAAIPFNPALTAGPHNRGTTETFVRRILSRWLDIIPRGAQSHLLEDITRGHAARLRAGPCDVFPCFCPCCLIPGRYCSLSPVSLTILLHLIGLTVFIVFVKKINNLTV